MYHAFIRHQVRKSFASLGTVLPSNEVGNLAPDVEQSLPGTVPSAERAGGRQPSSAG